MKVKTIQLFGISPTRCPLIKGGVNLRWGVRVSGVISKYMGIADRCPTVIRGQTVQDILFLRIACFEF